MAKTTKKTEAKVEKAPKAKKEAVIKEVAPSIEEVHKATINKSKELEKEFPTEIVYEAVKKPLSPPVIEVKKEDLPKYEPDTIDQFDVFAKEKKGKVWVKDHELLKKIEGRNFTLNGTEYYGDLK